MLEKGIDQKNWPKEGRPGVPGYSKNVGRKIEWFSYRKRKKGKKKGYLSPRQPRSVAREVKLVMALRHMTVLTILPPNPNCLHQI